MQNMSFGSDGALEAACKAKHPTNPGLCFMSPHMQDVMVGGFFLGRHFSLYFVYSCLMLIIRKKPTCTETTVSLCLVIVPSCMLDHAIVPQGSFAVVRPHACLITHRG
jgi:hypothetical protein